MIAFAAIALPAISPPPPIGITRQVEIRLVLQHFERDRALPGDDARIVVRMDRMKSRSRASVSARTCASATVSPCRTTSAPYALVAAIFTERRGHRHHDGRGDAEPRRVVGDGLRVIAGRHRDHAARAIVAVERGELVERAALLERIGDLQILVFDEHLGAGQLREPRRRQHRRAQNAAVDDRLGVLDVGQRDGLAVTILPDPLKRTVRDLNVQ